MSFSVTDKKPLLLVVVFLFVLCQVVRVKVVSIGYFVCNPGIAFGVVLPPALLSVLWICVMSGVLYLWHCDTSRAWYGPVAYVLIVAGAVSNLADRVIHGCVIDYINLVPWNSFNLADSLIVLGATLFIFQSLQKEK